MIAEKKVAQKLAKKGYSFVLIVPNIQPLYTKTLSHAIELSRDEYCDRRAKIPNQILSIGEWIKNLPEDKIFP